MLRLLLLTGFLFSAGCGHLRKPPQTGSCTGQIIAVSDTISVAGSTDTVRFGRMRSGEIAVKPLLLLNQTQHPLTIASYARTCGCTTLEYENQPLMPGDKKQLNMIFDTRGERGWQLKTVELYFAGNQRPLKLHVEAEVE